MLTITDNARAAIDRFIAKAGRPIGGLRILAAGGNCSGPRYLMRLETKAGPEDLVTDEDGLALFIDPDSSRHLEGVIIDFIDGEAGAGFTFDNPGRSGGGCSCPGAAGCPSRTA